jgi:hypothetical protein
MSSRQERLRVGNMHHQCLCIQWVKEAGRPHSEHNIGGISALKGYPGSEVKVKVAWTVGGRSRAFLSGSQPPTLIIRPPTSQLCSPNRKPHSRILYLRSNSNICIMLRLQELVAANYLLSELAQLASMIAVADVDEAGPGTRAPPNSPVLGKLRV